MQAHRQEGFAIALVATTVLAIDCSGMGNQMGPSGGHNRSVNESTVPTQTSTVLSFTPEADTYIYSVSPTTNFGSAPDINVGAAPSARIA